MIKTHLRKLLVAMLLFPALSFGAGDHVHLDHAPINAGDTLPCNGARRSL